jgi:ribonucleoside-diphosphate reductase alpha chain
MSSPCPKCHGKVYEICSLDPNSPVLCATCGILFFKRDKDGKPKGLNEYFYLANGYQPLPLLLNPSKSLGEKRMDEKKILPLKRPEKLNGVTYKITTGCGNIYVTVTEFDGKPFEVFARLGKAGGCASAQTEIIGRLVSLCLRAGVAIEEILDQIRLVKCDRAYGFGADKVWSCGDAIGKALEIFCKEKGLLSENSTQKPLQTQKENYVTYSCPKCGSPLTLDEKGCLTCSNPTCTYEECY